MDWRGRFNSNGIWHSSGRWGKDGTWRGASAPRRSGAHGQVSGHGVIRLRSRGAERFVTMRDWGDATSYAVGSRVSFRLDWRGEAVNVALAPGRTDNGQKGATSGASTGNRDRVRAVWMDRKGEAMTDAERICGQLKTRHVPFGEPWTASVRRAMLDDLRGRPEHECRRLGGEAFYCADGSLVYIGTEIQGDTPVVHFQSGQGEIHPAS